MTQAVNDSPFLVPLHAAVAAGVAEVGAKAATLGMLAGAGLAVPEGVVLTTSAARATLDAARLGGGDATPADVVAAPLPPEVEAALAAVAARFGEAVLAVRSSGVEEDLAGASFAGQYDTVLHVRGPDALAAAVRRCWASAYTDRLRAYRPGRAPTPLAVLVQRQVQPDVAGVAFSANPVTGNPDEVLVSAVPGLGDGVVAGWASPDEWVVRDGDATLVRATHQALAEPQARAVAALARRAADLLGGPQDVEWAMAGGRLLVLQARPITALPIPPVVDLPPGTWFKDVEHYAEPFTAFGASVAAPAVAEGLSSMFEAFGALLDRMEVRILGGEAYLRPVPIGGRNGPPPPWWVLAVLARLSPQLRRRVRRARAMVRPAVFEQLREEWETRTRPQMEADAARLRALDPAALDSPTLRRHLEDAVDLLRRGLHEHFQLIPLYAVALDDLFETCSALLGWDEATSLALLAGSSSTSSAPTRALEELAQRVAESPAALAALAAVAASPDGTGGEVAGGEVGPSAEGPLAAGTAWGGGEVGRRLAEADPELGAAFASWCDRFGHRCIHDDPGSPRWVERPWLLAGLLEGLVGAHQRGEPTATERAGQARAAAIERARAALARRPPADRAAFEAALATATRFYPLREESAFWGASVPAGVVRAVLMEAGTRLAASGGLSRPDDVVHLDHATVGAALAGKGPGDLRQRVARARAERAWVMQHPGPASYGPPPEGGPPDLRGLPAPARRLNEALLRGQPKPAEPGPQPTGAAPHGAGAAPQPAGTAPQLAGAAPQPGADRPVSDASSGSPDRERRAGLRSSGDDARRLTGAAASAGRYTGPARIVRTEADFARVRAGDVLVCPTTDPAWSVLFGRIGALVTDHGGLLAHAAIIAREHGIPAVVGTGSATGILRDGDVVSVDGGRGEVTLGTATADAADGSG